MNLTNRASRTLTLIAICIASLFPGLTARGQTRVQIAPQIVEAIVSPGGTLSEIISFTNAGSAPVDVALELADFDVDETGNPHVSALGTGETTLAPYLRVSPLGARIGIGESARFRLSANLPSEFDHLRIMIYFVATPVEMPERSAQQTVIVPKIGVPVYVESTTSDPARLELDQIELTRAAVAGHLQLALLSTNVGDRIIRPPVTIEVESRDGSFYEIFEPNSGIAPVLPHHTRRWSFEIGPVPDGELEVTLTFPTSRRESYRSTRIVGPATAHEAAETSK